MAIVLVVMASSVVTMFCGYFGMDLFGLKSLRADSMSRENMVLKAQLSSLNRKLDEFQLVMKGLGNSDDQLRTSVNLPPIPNDMRKVAVGGVEVNRDYGVSADANGLIANATNTLEVLSREANLQGQSYTSILNKYQSNRTLFEHIPAINPIRGGVITDGFGMRFHPILKIRIMHEGIDLVADYGTPIYAPGRWDGFLRRTTRRIRQRNRDRSRLRLFDGLRPLIQTDGQRRAESEARASDCAERKFRPVYRSTFTLRGN